MATSVGYVGTLCVETRKQDRMWFALTKADHGDEWVTVDDSPGSPKAWFGVTLEPGDARQVQLAKLALLVDAHREKQQIVVWHPDKPYDNTWFMERGDTFHAEGIRSLRVGLHEVDPIR